MEKYTKTVSFTSEECYIVWAALTLVDEMLQDEDFLRTMRKIFELHEEAVERRFDDEHGQGYYPTYLVGKSFDLLEKFGESDTGDSPAVTAEEKLQARICSDAIPLPDFILSFNWDAPEGDD